MLWGSTAVREGVRDNVVVFRGSDPEHQARTSALSPGTLALALLQRGQRIVIVSDLVKPGQVAAAARHAVRHLSQPIFAGAVTASARCESVTCSAVDVWLSGHDERASIV